MNQKLVLFLSLILLVWLIGGSSPEAARGQYSVPQAPAAALGTAFTYQGYLNDGASPAEGSYDFRFILYDAEIGGAQVGSTVALEDQPVSGGYFTVQLNFGAGSFGNKALWLEVAVRPGASSGAYSVLSPRQALTPSPFALFSTNAGSAPWSGLSGIPAGFADGIDNDTLYTAGSGLSLVGGQFSVSFAGSGSATTVARSDHNHLGQTWIGSNNALSITGNFNASGNYAPLVLNNGTGNGLYVGSAATKGVVVVSSGTDGLYVQSAGSPSSYTISNDKNGVEVAGAGGNGVYVGRADAAGVAVNSAGTDGVFVQSAGSPSTSTTSSNKNGVEVAGAEGNGLYIGRSDGIGVYMNSAGAGGVYIGSAAGSGMFVLSSGGDGFAVQSAGQYIGTASSSQNNGFEVGGAEGNGLFVGKTGADGVYVYSAGEPSTTNASSYNNGVEVAGAERYGLYVGRSDASGIYVNSAGSNGLFINSVVYDGVRVDYSVEDGLEVNYANLDGVHANTEQADGEWGIYTDDKIHGSNVAATSLTLLAQVGGPVSLVPGDLVSAAGLGQKLPESTEMLPLVRLADGVSNGVIGVVEGRMAFTVRSQGEGENGEPHPELCSAEGPAQPGDYVALRVLGVALVKADSMSGVIQPGERLTASNVPGSARPLQKVEVNRMVVAESAPVIGVALSAPDENGMVWVLVNPQ